MLTKLKTISTLAIFLGALGLLSVLTNAASLAVGTARIQAAVAMPLPNPEAALAQAEMNVALAAVVDSWRAYNVVMVALLLGVSACLLAGGLQALRLRERGRRLLGAAFVAGVAVELLRGVSSISVSFATAQITQGYMARIMRAGAAQGGGLSPEADKIASAAASGFTNAGAAVGLMIAAGWILAQIVFYVIGAVYLRKPDVRGAFQQA